MTAIPLDYDFISRNVIPDNIWIYYIHNSIFFSTQIIYDVGQ